MKQILLALPLFAACGSDPVNYSAPVGIELTSKSSDVSGTTITSIKDIQTESGNPYAHFVTDATAKLGGKTPTRIELQDLTLALGPQSTGVTKLEQVLTGDVDVAFVVNSSNASYDAGHIMNPTGAGPDSMDVVFDWSKVAAADQQAIIGGSFKVVLTGTAAQGFSTANANIDLPTTFTFAAFQ